MVPVIMFALILSLCLQLQFTKGVEVPCTTGFPVLSSDGSSRSFGSTRVIPDMNISCTGTLTGWSIAGRTTSGASLSHQFPSLKIFRPINLASRTYSYVGEVELGKCGAAFAEETQNNIYTCSLPADLRLSVRPNDIIGIFSPDERTQPTGFVVHFLSGSTSAPINYVYTNNNVTTDIAIEDAATALNTLQINLEIAQGNDPISTSIVHSTSTTPPPGQVNTTTLSLNEDMITTTIADDPLPTVIAADPPAASLSPLATQDTLIMTTQHELTTITNGGNSLVPTTTIELTSTYIMISPATSTPPLASVTPSVEHTPTLATTTGGPDESTTFPTSPPPAGVSSSLPLIAALTIAVVIIVLLLLIITVCTVAAKRSKKTSSVVDSGAVQDIHSSGSNGESMSKVVVLENIASMDLVEEVVASDALYTEISACTETEGESRYTSVLSTVPEKESATHTDYETITNDNATIQWHVKPRTLEVSEEQLPEAKPDLSGMASNPPAEYDHLGDDTQYERIGEPQYDKVSHYEKVTSQCNDIAAYDTATTYEKPSTYEQVTTYEKTSTYESAATYEKPSMYEATVTYEKPSTYEKVATYERAVTYEKVTSSFTSTDTIVML